MPNSDRQNGPEFIHLLRQAGVEADDRRLAEMVWLARLLTTTEEESPRQADAPVVRAETNQTSFVSSSAAAVARAPIETLTVSYRDEPAKAGAFLNTAAIDSGEIHVSRRRVAGVPPLPEAAAIAHSLRPFQRGLRSPRPGPLDEEATVEQIAESDLIIPVQAPARERWFDAVVVFEDRPGMVVWRETIREFRHLLERHGAFRDAQLWRLQFPEKQDKPEKHDEPKQADPVLLSPSGAKRDPQAISDPTGRRLIFLFSDGVAPVWRDGRMRQVVDRWGGRMPVALVQVINEEQWFRTAHGDPSLRVTAPQPGSANRRLTHPDHQKNADDDVILPIVMPYPRSLARWAEMLMKGSVAVPALSLSQPVDAPQLGSQTEITTEQRIAMLPSLLSDTAFKLACYLSAVPLQIPVMRLVQRVMLPDSRIEHLAEVMLSGVIKRTYPEQDVSKLADDEIDFDFSDPEIRKHLWGQLRFGELDYVLKCVSDYVSERIGRRCDLRALIEDSEGALKVSKEEWPFARIAAQALSLHGIRPISGRGERIVTSGTGWVNLSRFEFKTVTLDVRGEEIKNGRRSLTARQFVEELDKDVTLEMVEIPGGTFTMGSPKSEAERIDDEGPQHDVTVAPFYLGKFTITQAQWRVVAGLEKIERDLKPDPSYFKDRKDSDQRPVEQISWEDAQEFCARLAQKTGRAYRLPTEAEWEYACRAGMTTPFAFGETITHKIVNYDSDFSYAKAPKKKQRGETVPVGSLGVANAFGLCDMHGNVWEWCQDVWHNNYEGAPIDGSAWTEGGNQERRVLRGGSYNDNGRYCRSAFRLNYAAHTHDQNSGLRVCVPARSK